MHQQVKQISADHDFDSFLTFLTYAIKKKCCLEMALMNHPWMMASALSDEKFLWRTRLLNQTIDSLSSEKLSLKGPNESGSD